MQIGFFAIGIGTTADPEILALTARTLERTGFHSVWAPERFVWVDHYTSKSPYYKDGKVPLPSTIDILDPFAALTFAAAHTTALRLGTGVCLVPERNPAITAKEVASLDRLSGGRLDFGVGVGWLAEEFAAVGVPWEQRAARTREYLEAMKLLWTEEEAEFDGEFCQFPKVRLYPKPVQKPYPPIIFGGESMPALKRVAEVGDGWFGVKVTVAEAKAKIERIRRYAKAVGRDPGKFHFAVAPGPEVTITADMIRRYGDTGVDELITYGEIPSDLKAIDDEIERLAERLVVPAQKI